MALLVRSVGGEGDGWARDGWIRGTVGQREKGEYVGAKTGGLSRQANWGGVLFGRELLGWT